MLVENGCVHQHFNDSESEECSLVFKAKPLFLFYASAAAEDGGMAAGAHAPTTRLCAAEGPIRTFVARMSEAISGDRSATTERLTGGTPLPDIASLIRATRSFHVRDRRQETGVVRRQDL